MLQRYFTLNGSGITSNVTFHYLDGDVPPAPSVEANYKVIKVSGGAVTRFTPDGSTVILNAAGNTFTMNGLTTYSDWTAGDDLAPTAAPVGIAGRVVTQSGRGLFGAKVSITDQAGNTRTATTNPFGYFRFAGVESGQTYVVNVSHKWYRFTTRSISVNDEISGLDFIAQP